MSFWKAGRSPDRPVRSSSILSRILFLHGVAVVITAIIMPFLLYWLQSSDVDNLQRRALQVQAEAIARHLDARADSGWSLDLPPGLRDQYSEAYGRYAYAVLDEAGHVLFSSRKDLAPVFPIDARPATPSFHTAQRGERTVFGASLPTQVAGQRVWVQVAEDLGHRDVLVDDVVDNFFANVGWVTAPILLLLLATDIIIFRRAVQPLLRASQRASQVSPRNIDVRLPLDGMPREIRPLVVGVNAALDRLQQGFRRQREFAADVAHELRTPLSILRSRIDTLPDQHGAKALHRDVEIMARVVSQLLDAAEMEIHLVDPKDRADLHGICAEVAESVAPLALAQGKTIALTGAERPVWIRANADMLRLAVRNLVDNAINHTPRAKDVAIVVGERGTVSILDEGEGVPLANREQIFERFWRRDRHRNGGAGLGLSIVRRIVEAHGARITVDSRPGGGASFSMHFLLADLPETLAAPPADAVTAG
jgi:signal transduction histidine kinase